MKLFTFLILLFFCNRAFSQHIQFNWQSCQYQAGYERDVMSKPSIVSTNDGYMVLSTVETGYYTPPPELPIMNIWLFKIDSVGILQWEKYFGSSSGAVQIVPADLDNYYIFGSTDSSVTSPTYLPNGGLWYIKIDGNGNKIWDKVVGSDNMVLGAGAFCIPTLDKGILSLTNLVGIGGDITNSFGFWDAWLLKLNAQGDIEWDFTLGTDGFDIGGLPIQTSDSGYLIPMSSADGTTGNIICTPPPQPTINSRAVIVKLDSAHNIEWQQCFEASYHLLFQNTLEVADGYIIGGSAYAGDGAVEGAGYHIGYNNQGEQTCDLWLRKIDFDGNLIWQKCYGGSGNDWPLQLLKTTDGNVVVFGQTQSRDGDVAGIHADPPYLYPLSEDVWMLKVNGTNGNLLWNRCIGSDRREFINNGVIQKDDRNYVLAIQTQASYRNDITCGDPEYEFFAWVSSITDTTAYVGIYDLVDISHTIKLYPNPADDYIVVEISPQFDMQNYQAEIINSEGRIVKTFSLSGTKPYLNTANLPSGLYQLRLENQKITASKKFMKK
ncbi:MAG: T9SS type A sorting domain-containing protein [Lentimicrobium sp.]|nr:T9SS type A sorting domain-containing protein [Lentimicrobium sp.]